MSRYRSRRRTRCRWAAVAILPVAGVLGCAGPGQTSAITERLNDPGCGSATSPADDRSDYLAREAGSVLEEDARQARPATPPKRPLNRHEPEPIQRKPTRPVDQPRLR